MAAKKDERCRQWTAEFYPESAPENWREIISGWLVPCCVSPLHEFDLNPDGAPKKAHYHLQISFDGNKSFDQVVEMLKPLNGPIPIKTICVRSMVRYFCHVDNPEKHRYNKEDMLSFSGFDFDQYFTYAQIERLHALREMRQFCRDNDITEFHDFVDYCDSFRHDWQEVLDTSGTIPIKAYLQSRHFKTSGGVIK